VGGAGETGVEGRVMVWLMMLLAALAAAMGYWRLLLLDANCCLGPSGNDGLCTAGRASTGAKQNTIDVYSTE